jgi:ABC-2 type transport system permease protein
MNAFLIARRDIAAQFHGFLGYQILAGFLFTTGVGFYVLGLGAPQAYSHDVLQWFFMVAGTIGNIAIILVTMRSLADERQSGTEVLLRTSAATEAEIVGGKYLAAMAIVGAMLSLTFYMPALIVVNGKVSISHILSGYLGTFLMCSTTAAIGIAASAAFRNQLAAGIAAGIVVGVLILSFNLAPMTEGVFSDVLDYVALWEKHFLPFTEGRIRLRSLVYFISVTLGALFAATKVLEGRRWQ